MAARIVAVAFVAVSLLLVAASGLVRLPDRKAPVQAQRVDPLQCGHWCIERCALLLGVPTTMADVQKLAPVQENVMSLLDVKNALSALGIKAVAFRTNPEELTQAELPCVAHLTHPDHFVVLASRTARGFRVFDNANPRRNVKFDELRPRWSGNVMRVQRAETGIGVAESGSSPKSRHGPRIQFETLYDDVDVGHDTEEVVYEFPFSNQGTEPLTILKVQPSCSCLHVERPMQPVAVGAEGVIKLVYRVEAVDNPIFGYQAVVTSNDPRTPTIKLHAEGTVDLRLTPRRFSLGDVVLERPQTFTCRFWDHVDSSEPLIQGVMTTLGGTTVRWEEQTDGDSDKWQAQGLRPKKCPSCGPSRRTLDITLVPKSEPDGEFKATIFVKGHFGDGVSEVPIHLSGRFVLPVIASPRSASFEDVQTGEKYHTAVSLTADQARPFRVLSVTAPERITHHITGESTRSETRIEIHGDAVDLLRASGSNIDVRLRFEDSKREYTLRLPIHAWPADASESKS